MDQTLRMDIVKLLVSHGVPAAELVPTARDVLAFVSEGDTAPVLPSATTVPAVDNKKPEPVLTSEAAAEEGRKDNGYWTARAFELERWCASGAPYGEIAAHFGTTNKAIVCAANRLGISGRWPRKKGPGNYLLFTPVPLDVPWPGDRAEAGDRSEAEPEAGILPTRAGMMSVPADTVPAREVLRPRRARPTIPPAAAGEMAIVGWLCERGFDVAKIDGVWRWEKDTGLTFRQILARANNLRIRNKLPPFADPDPDPLAGPVDAAGRSICGSSLRDVE